LRRANWVDSFSACTPILPPSHGSFRPAGAGERMRRCRQQKTALPEGRVVLAGRYLGVDRFHLGVDRFSGADLFADFSRAARL
jgi:hypothetical protein